MSAAGVLTRAGSGMAGTFGRLRLEAGCCLLELATLELPWRENERGRSCIPVGRYAVRWGASSKGMCYRLDAVPGRSGILIHAGNWAGDVREKLRSDTEGCILVGMDADVLEGQAGLRGSARAVAALREFLGREGWMLEIR